MSTASSPAGLGEATLQRSLDTAPGTLVVIQSGHAYLYHGMGKDESALEIGGGAPTKVTKEDVLMIVYASPPTLRHKEQKMFVLSSGKSGWLWSYYVRRIA